MNEITDLQVIECSRLHSEEAKSNNNENYSLWTNNLTDIVHLKPGDKISVHGAMISERGAGQSSSIEIKGVDLGIQKTFHFIEQVGTNASSELASGYQKIDANLSSKVVDIRDDTAVFNTQYYISANGHNYIQLPRRWWWNSSASGMKDNWFNKDSVNSNGMSLWDPFNANGSTATLDRFQIYDDFYQTTINGSKSKLRNNNDRYTLMIRNTTYFSESEADGNLTDKGLRDPENAEYRIYSELKEIELPKGFNSPEYIASEFTRQLQQVKKEELLSVRNASDLAQNPYLPGFGVPIYKTFETETYKPFNVASIYKDEYSLTNESEKDYNFYFNASTNASGWEYLSQYQIIGCKRPEIYEKGRLINIKGTQFNGIKGSETLANYTGAYNTTYGSNGLIIYLEYTKTNCDKLRDFILAQQKYPEIWNTFSDQRTLYNSGDTYDNSVWFHMNRYSNASMTLDPSDTAGEKAQLGWGGYINPSWRTDPGPQLSSILVPFKYDSSQKDKFYEYKDLASKSQYPGPREGLNELTYGFIGMTDPNVHGFDEQYIVVYPTDANGSGSVLYQYLMRGGFILDASTKFGFDYHFSAPGVGYVLPFAGYDANLYSVDDRAFEKVGDYSTAKNSDDHVLTNYRVNTRMYRKKIYIGADVPELGWDGTNFGFKFLHTGMNRGNQLLADNTFTTLNIASDPLAQDIVYKINPKEDFQDWTPARKPYVGTVATLPDHSNASTLYYSHKFNENLEAWTVYDSLCGIYLSEFNLSESEWTGTIWDLLGFSYRQFHSDTNTRNLRINRNNQNSLSLITTNSQISVAEQKSLFQNTYAQPLYRNMLPNIASLYYEKSSSETDRVVAYYPEITGLAPSIEIVADNLPTRMIRGYYTIRSNIISETPFVGGKKDNVYMPIIGVVDKINGDGDFYFGQESSLEFTITKPLSLASITCSVHDPDGSYANTSEQNTVLLKVQKQRNVSFNILQEILEQNKGKLPPNL